MSDKNPSSLASDEVLLYLERAYASEERNEFERALEQCNTAIQISPDLAEAYNLRGIILEELGRKEGAILAYREAVRLDSSFQEARENLQDIETELKEDRFRTRQIEGKGFGIRAAAYIIDSIIMFISNFVAGTLGGLALGIVLGIVLILTGREFYFSEQPTQCLNLISGLILSVLYFTIFEWLYGATLGKLVFGLRVVKESGEPCDFRVSFIRALYRFIDGLFFGIPAYNSMKSPLNQRIGDKKAETVVVGSKESIIQQPRAWWWFLVATGLYLTLATIVVIFLGGMALR